MKVQKNKANDLQTKALGQISAILSRSEDVQTVLNDLLVRVIELTGQCAGWIYLRDDAIKNLASGSDFYLAAFYSRSKELDIAMVDSMQPACECQDLFNGSEIAEAYDHLPCNRLSAENKNRPYFQAHATIPLCSGNRRFGMLNVVATDGKAADPRVLDLLTIVSTHLSTALDRRYLATRERERRIHEQTTLLTLTSQLLRRMKLEDVMSLLVQEVIRLFEVDASALLLPDEQLGFLMFRASAGWHSDPVIEHRRVSNNDYSSSGKVMRTQLPILSAGSTNREDIPEMTIEWLGEEDFEGLAIVPLLVDGTSIGALALTMRTQRQFEEDEIRMLQILANQAGIAIVNARLQQEEIRAQRLEEELSVGWDIQRSLLPASSPAVVGWQFSDVYRPARRVSGDLYDYFELPFGGERLGLVIGDVAGKGVPAALFMATSRTLIRSAALSGLTPASALSQANRLILQDSASELFLSAFYGILDTRNGSLNYANAGHNPPFCYQHASGKFLELNARGMILCVQEKIKIEEKSLNIAKGDILVLYTDGVTEAVNKVYEEFGPNRLQEVVAANYQKSAAKIVESIVDAVDSFIGGTTQPDDLTLIVGKRL